MQSEDKQMKLILNLQFQRQVYQVLMRMAFNHRYFYN